MNNTSTQTTTINSKERLRLTRAVLASPSTISLEFGDGQLFSLAIELLGMPLDRIEWSSLQVSLEGESVTFQGAKGDLIPVDTATLRYLVDKTYAAEIDKSLESLQLSRDELREMARDNSPPSRWYAEPERDLTRDSWK